MKLDSWAYFSSSPWSPTWWILVPVICRPTCFAADACIGLKPLSFFFRIQGREPRDVWQHDILWGSPSRSLLSSSFKAPLRNCLFYRSKVNSSEIQESLKGTSQVLRICSGKNCIFLPAVGKQNATFSPDFTQPGKSLIEVPCTSIWRSPPAMWS